jgi:predicted DNA-binding transcriptional regulator AlpA
MNQQMTSSPTAPAAQDATLSDRFLTINEGLHMLGVSRTAGYQWIADDILPRPREMGPRRTGWLHSELLEWMRNRPVTKQQPRKKRVREPKPND